MTSGEWYKQADLLEYPGVYPDGHLAIREHEEARKYNWKVRSFSFGGESITPADETNPLQELQRRLMDGFAFPVPVTVLFSHETSSLS
ncbi:MAG: hypothetical protein M1358_15800 [Chloroflexi bacterium]|nr:hypothetical protein [Chloroflexota bacterium]